MIQPNDMGDAPTGPGLSAPEGAPIPIAWQPIETAPKQSIGLCGEDLLLWDGASIRVGSWFKDSWIDGNAFDIEATHWMPLPAPPQGVAHDRH